MELMNYRTGSLINNLRKDINRLFEGWELIPLQETQIFPKVDIKEESDKLILKAEIPGIDPKDVQVFINKNNALVIKGNTEQESHTEKEGFLRMERFSGNFYREFPLSSNVKSEQIQARSKQGVLEITLPKAVRENSEKLIEIQKEE